MKMKVLQKYFLLKRTQILHNTTGTLLSKHFKNNLTNFFRATGMPSDWHNLTTMFTISRLGSCPFKLSTKISMELICSSSSSRLMAAWIAPDLPSIRDDFTSKVQIIWMNIILNWLNCYLCILLLLGASTFRGQSNVLIQASK